MIMCSHLIVSQKELVEQSQQFTLVDGVLHHIHFSNSRAGEDNMFVQICLPSSFVPLVLCDLHDSPIGGHLSAHTTYMKAIQRYHWKNMWGDIENYCKSCIVCNKRKQPHRQQALP